MAGETQELNLDQADELLLAGLNLLGTVAKHFGLVPLAQVCQYIAEHADERRWLLAFVGLTNESAFTAGPSAELNAFGGLGSLLEIAKLLKDFAPLVKEYLPQIKQLLEVAKTLFDLWKNVQPKPAPGTADPTTRPSF